MPATSLTEVISILDTIIEECIQQNSRAGYFASLYKRMTIAVKNGIENGMFEDGVRMEKLDVIFANRYFDAYELWKQNKQTTQCWMVAFDGTQKNQLIVLQHLVLGINAHINLDLGIAAAQTAGTEIQKLKNDFDKINTVISSLIDTVQNELEQIWWPLKFIERIANKKDDAVINFSISIARKSAWNVAVQASALKGKALDDYIKTVDTGIAFIANKIASPGFFIRLILKFIKVIEDKNVVSVIETLNKY